MAVTTGSWSLPACPPWPVTVGTLLISTALPVGVVGLDVGDIIGHRGGGHGKRAAKTAAGTIRFLICRYISRNFSIWKQNKVNWNNTRWESRGVQRDPAIHRRQSRLKLPVGKPREGVQWPPAMTPTGGASHRKTRRQNELVRCKRPACPGQPERPHHIHAVLLQQFYAANPPNLLSLWYNGCPLATTFPSVDPVVRTLADCTKGVLGNIGMLLIFDFVLRRFLAANLRRRLHRCPEGGWPQPPELLRTRSLQRTIVLSAAARPRVSPVMLNGLLGGLASVLPLSGTLIPKCANKKYYGQERNVKSQGNNASAVPRPFMSHRTWGTGLHLNTV